MSLSVDQIEVGSFETTAAGTDAVAEPVTTPRPCYSPLCIPTDLPEQCPEKQTSTC